MSKVTLDVKYIASIYPGKLEPIKRYVGPSSQMNTNYGFCTTYVLPPWPREGVQKQKGERIAKQFSGTEKRPAAANLSWTPRCWVLEVSDAYEKYLDANESGMMGHHVYHTKPVTCEELVSDILRHWAGQMVDTPVEYRPGIIEIANTVPTEEDMETMYTMQKGYMEYHFARGERLDADKKNDQISPVMRLAADWLGPDYARMWGNPGAVGRSTLCPACQMSIPINAYKCGKCGTTLRALPPELAVLNQPPPQPPLQPAA